MNGNIFGCHNWGSSGQRIGMLLNTLQYTGQRITPQQISQLKMLIVLRVRNSAIPYGIITYGKKCPLGSGGTE